MEGLLVNDIESSSIVVKLASLVAIENDTLLLRPSHDVRYVEECSPVIPLTSEHVTLDVDEDQDCPDALNSSIGG